MRVLANGEAVELADGATLVDLFAAVGVGARWVVAEVNGDAIPRADMAVHQLREGDRVELVRAVAGG